jgi:hypothetical protein
MRGKKKFLTRLLVYSSHNIRSIPSSLPASSERGHCLRRNGMPCENPHGPSSIELTVSGSDPSRTSPILDKKNCQWSRETRPQQLGILIRWLPDDQEGQTHDQALNVYVTNRKIPQEDLQAQATVEKASNQPSFLG